MLPCPSSNVDDVCIKKMEREKNELGVINCHGGYGRVPGGVTPVIGYDEMRKNRYGNLISISSTDQEYY